jgi:sugar phosphate isomerase/epimerase
MTNRIAAASANRVLRLGGPIFVKSEEPAAMAQAHRDLGYRAAYAPKVELEDRELIREIISEYAARDVVIAEVGAWVNMVDRDPAKRKKSVDFVTQRLALAEELGARCCVDIAGSFNPDAWDGPHPDNFGPEFFDATVEVVRQVIDNVQPRRTRFAIEMMGWTLPSSPDEYLDLIKAVDRRSFAVHMDVCNLINSPYRIYDNESVIEEAFEKLGPWVASCHAKDVAWVPGSQVHFKEVIPGTGVLDYATYLRELAKLPGEAPLMLEHLNSAEEYQQGSDYIRSVAREVDISFG